MFWKWSERYVFYWYVWRCSRGLQKIPTVQRKYPQCNANAHCATLFLLPVRKPRFLWVGATESLSYSVCVFLLFDVTGNLHLFRSVFPCFVCSIVFWCFHVSFNFVCIRFHLLVWVTYFLLVCLCGCGLLIPYLCLGSRKCFSVSNKTKTEYFAFLSHINPRTF